VNDLDPSELKKVIISRSITMDIWREKMRLMCPTSEKILHISFIFNASVNMI